MDTPKSNPPLQMPKLREHLSVAFNDYDREGKPQWLIHDAGRNKFFLIGWLEYELMERWHLHDPEKIIESINNETTLHIEQADIENFIQFLKRNYLIKQSAYSIHQLAKEQALFKTDNWIHWLIHNYLFFRIPLVHPDAFLSRTMRFARLIFSSYVFYIMLGLGIIALYQLSVQWDEFTHTFSSIFTIKGLFFSMLAFVIMKFCHEMAHAYMCKSYGVPVPSMGVAFLVFWPVLYTDTTQSWSLGSRKRLRIAFAGIWIETYVTIIAALIWCNTNNLTLQTICYVTISVNWIASLLINVSPFMRFDGYYILADYLKMPNLQPRAFSLTRWQIRRWLFDWQEPVPEKFNTRMHWFLVGYSIATWLYRLVLYLGIAVLVYHFFIKIIGLMLFSVEMLYFVLLPFVTEVKTWIQYKDKFTWNIHTRITVGVSSILVLLFFLPINNSVKFPGTVSYAHQFLVAPNNSILISAIPAPNTPVKANQTIITLDSPELTEAIHQLELEYQKKLSELRRAGISEQYTAQKNILLSDIKKIQSQYAKLMEIKNKFNLSVPFDGVISETASELKPGTILRKDEWLGDVIQPSSIRIEAFVSEEDIHLVFPNLKGYFYPANLSLASIPVKVLSIEILNTESLSCKYSTILTHGKNENFTVETPCYNASDFGGGVPTQQDEAGNYVPTTSTYRVILISNDTMPLKYVERGIVVLKTSARSYASRVYYKIKKILLEESGF
jgi:putative peptide zinc metalloprotease protein